VPSEDALRKSEENRIVGRSSQTAVVASGPGRLSSSRRRVAAAFGQLLRQLPEVDENKAPITGDKSGVTKDDEQPIMNRSSSEDSIVRAWAILRRVHAENARQAQNDDDWIIRRLKHLKRGKNSQRKHRGRGGSDERREGGGNDSAAEGENAPGGSAQQPQGGGNGGAESSSRRSVRQLSGGSASSSSSSGTDSANLDFDPHIGAVLLRMHRELQHVNRQLELVEGILITQQHMIRGMMSGANQDREKKMRLGFFSNLPWRTIAFILAWPVVVNILVRLFRPAVMNFLVRLYIYSRMKRRR